jgi:hypothetical protein
MQIGELLPPESGRLLQYFSYTQPCPNIYGVEWSHEYTLHARGMLLLGHLQF